MRVLFSGLKNTLNEVVLMSLDIIPRRAPVGNQISGASEGNRIWIQRTSRMGVGAAIVLTA